MNITYCVKNIKETDIGSRDFKDFLLDETIILNNCIDMKNYPNIKKWLCYQLFQPKDADFILKNSDVIYKLNWYDENKKNNKVYLDCIFSMRTYFNMFLRMFHPNAANHAWLLTYFDDIINEKTTKKFCTGTKLSLEDFNNCLYEIEKFAKNTNTLGNYMPAPDAHYNKIKGLRNNKYNDRLDLFLALLYSGKDLGYNEYITWFNEYSNNLSLDLDSIKAANELTNFKYQAKLKFNETDIQDFTKYIRFVNSWIENRTHRLINKLQNIG